MPGIQFPCPIPKLGVALWVESSISFDPAITGELPEEPSGPAAQDPEQ